MAATQKLAAEAEQRAGAVLVPANRPGWQRLEPGIPTSGVEVVRL